jgi:hypothetical protein
MTTSIRRLARLAIAGTLLGGVFIAGVPLAPPISKLSTAAHAANGIRSVSNLCFWEDLSWDELRPAEQKAWANLGWTAAMWESEAETAIPPSEFKDWDELNSVEQRALRDLGYTAETWESFDADTC